MQSIAAQNLKLADLCAKKWRGVDKSIDYDDYYQTACVGLVRAANRWNKEGGASFSGYAYRFMDGEVKRMRSIHCTNHRDGFRLGITPPTWVQIDHSFDEEDSQADRLLGGYSHNFVLREAIQKMELSSVPAKQDAEQGRIRSFIVETKAKMKEMKVSITSLAKKIGVTQPTLSRWLSNDTRLTPERRETIARALEELT